MTGGVEIAATLFAVFFFFRISNNLNTTAVVNSVIITDSNNVPIIPVAQYGTVIEFD